MKEGEIEEEEIEEEEEREVQVNFNADVKPSKGGYIEVIVTNPQSQDIKIELDLLGKIDRLTTKEEEKVFRIDVEPLDPGEYKIPYKVSVDGEIKEEAHFVLIVKPEEKRLRKEDKLDEMLDELLDK